MSEQDNDRIERRRILKLLGGTAVAAPLAALVSACSSDEPPPPAEAPAEPPPEPAAEAPAPEPAPEPAPAPAAELTPLSEDDPQAQQLSYVEDASTVDPGRFPRYEDGQLCSNCALWQGGDAEAGGCALFPGKSVKAAGWCSAYAPAG